jgi:hypothetical protein
MVFLTFLVSDKELGIQFLKDVGLIPTKVLCNTCGHDMAHLHLKVCACVRCAISSHSETAAVEVILYSVIFVLLL